MRYPMATTCAIAVCCFGATLTRADIKTATWNSETSYEYEVKHMPDFDQSRSTAQGIPGLPGGGNMYCVPTSITNLMAYAHSHGFPDVAPDCQVVSCDWRLPGNYDGITTTIDLMGDFMGTHPTNGTSWGPATVVAKAWVAQSGNLTVNTFLASGSYAPTVETMALQGILGGIVVFGYGRYELIDDNGDVVQVDDRTGGHYITLARVARNGSTLSLESRDPADNNDSPFSQSQFGNRVHDVETVGVFRLDPFFASVMNAIEHPSGDGLIRLIDSVMTITPSTGWSWSPSGVSINLNMPLVMDPSLPNLTSLIVNPVGAQLQDVVIHPDQIGMYVLTVSENLPGTWLRYIDRVTGESSTLKRVTNDSQLVLSRQRKIYLMMPDELQLLDDEFEVAVLQPLPFESGIDAVYDDTADELVVLSIDERTVLRYPPGLLETDAVEITVPGQIPMAGDGQMAINPVDGAVWILSDASNDLYGFVSGVPGVQVISDPDLEDPTSIDFDDAGRAYISNNGQVIEFERDQQTDAWARTVNSRAGFDGLATLERFHITRSRTNFDPETMSGPAWNNVDPDELVIGEFKPDCHADVNESDTVDIVDLLALFGAWGACECHEDVNADGAVDVLDLLEMLASWGPCE